jgi:hypothetical protein
MKKLISMNEFAHNLGQHVRLTRDASLPLHNIYVAAEPEAQGEMRVSWLLNHLTGQGYTPKQAESVCAASRNDRSAEQQRDYDKARGDFAYHIVRSVSAKAEVAPKTAKIRLPNGTVERVAEAYVGLTREQIIAAHERALATLDFE